MKNNGLKYLVVAALLINVVTLFFFWFKRPPRGDRPPRQQPFEVMTRELQLNNEQQAAFKILREQHHRSHDSLLQLMTEKRQLLYTQKPASIDSATQQIGLLQQEIEKVTYQHFEAVRQVCTPEQQKKLDKMLVGAVQHVLTPQNDGPPPPKRD